VSGRRDLAVWSDAQINRLIDTAYESMSEDRYRALVEQAVAPRVDSNPDRRKPRDRGTSRLARRGLVGRGASAVALLVMFADFGRRPGGETAERAASAPAAGDQPHVAPSLPLRFVADPEAATPTPQALEAAVDVIRRRLQSRRLGGDLTMSGGVITMTVEHSDDRGTIIELVGARPNRAGVMPVRPVRR
jgi:hypothetical protein